MFLLKNFSLLEEKRIRFSNLIVLSHTLKWIQDLCSESVLD